MPLAIATTSIPGTLPRKLEAAAKAGFDAVELNEADLNAHDGDIESIRSLAESLGLRIALLQPFANLEGQEDQQQAFDRLAAGFDLMKRLGTEMLLVVSAHIMAKDVTRDRIRQDLATAAAMAGEHGMRLAYMALPWAASVTSEHEADALIKEIDNPHLGLALNSYFSLQGERRPADLRGIDGSRIFHVQLSDAPRMPADPATFKRNFALMPGQGGLNLQGFVRMLARMGYRGSWSIARLRDEMLAKDADAVTTDGYLALMTLLDDVARDEPALISPMPSLPPKVQAQGFEFIEFAVDGKSRDEITGMLAAMCFRMERRHISKDVELWRQGAINIVINADAHGYARQAFENHGACVCDMGIRVSDADATASRMTALGTPPFSQPVGSGELVIPAVQGVGGALVHFIDEKSDLHHVWDIEFDPVSKTAAIPPAGLRRIDHVAQTMDWDEMQSWLLYYTTTFIMKKSDLVNVTDPMGIVRSQAIQTPEGEVRLNLNGARGDQTFAGAFLADAYGAGVQHIAFQTDDIFETSVRLAESGFPRLQIPASYYDELALQDELDADLIQRLKDANIMVERDDGKTYFQIYSQPFFNGVFFEIVQRDGGYDGYGAGNASIRLTAQRQYQEQVGYGA